MIGNDAFQEADIVGITRPCTKYNFLVKDIRDLARTIKEAFVIATTRRPGPVLVDLPKDVPSTRQSSTIRPRSRSGRTIRKVRREQVADPAGGPGDPEGQAARHLRRGRRDPLQRGGGAQGPGRDESGPRGAHAHGPRAFPGRHPLFLGMLGMHGTYQANMALYKSDLVVAIGVRFDDRVTGKVDEFCPEAKIIHVDIDPTSIRRTSTSTSRSWAT